jgi:hypothetical protein
MEDVVERINATLELRVIFLLNAQKNNSFKNKQSISTKNSAVAQWLQMDHQTGLNPLRP